VDILSKSIFMGLIHVTIEKLKIMKLRYILFTFTIIIACNNSKDKVNDEIFKKKLIVILSQELEGNSNNINIQNYVQNGKSFIPVFTSKEKFQESTQGQIKNQKIEIDGIFLLSILHGNETLRINPGLIDEVDFDAGELIKNYSLDIARVNTELKKLKR
jgi:hypothetical protein